MPSVDLNDRIAAMWRMGLIGQGTPPTDPNNTHLPVPDLVGCTEHNGVGAGFPRDGSTASTDDFCTHLGLTTWSSN